MRGLLFFLLVLCVAAAAHAAPLNFERGGFWLVNPAPADIALRAGGADTARLSLYRLTDPALLAQVLAARASRSISEGDLLRRVTSKLQPVWQADWTLDAADPQAVPVPLLAAAGAAPANGVYVLTAGDGAERGAAQWFIRTGLSLDAQFAGGQAFVTAFDTAVRTPRGGTLLQWVTVDGEQVGEAATLPETGAALLPVPDGAALLLASGTAQKDNPLAAADLDFAAVPPRQTQATVPGALLYPAQDAAGKFQTLVVAPGAAPEVKADAATVALQAPLPGLWQGDVPTGTGDLIVRRDGQELAKATLHAAAALPVTWLQKPAALIGSKPVTVKFRLGAAFASQDGTLLLQPDAHEHSASLPFRTDAKGASRVTLDPAALQLTAPGKYRMTVQVAGAQSAPLSLQVWPAQSWLELTPQFADNVVPENVTAGFVARLRNSSGGAQAVPLTWELSREAYSFEWYQAEDGRWVYRTKTALQSVATGQASAGRAQTGFDVPVAAGRYRLTVQSGDRQAVQSFTAGWWLAPVPAETPEAVDVAAQVEAAPDGSERIAIFVDPPFPARVWLAALNSAGGAPVQTAEVPDEGGFIYVPRAALPPGQPLTIVAFAVPRDPGAALVRAEAIASQPLGIPATFTSGAPSPSGTPLAIGKLPGGAQALLTLNLTPDGKPETLLWQSSALEADANGSVQVTLPALPSATAVLARLFVAEDGRIDVIEHVLPATGAGKSVRPKR